MKKSKRDYKAKCHSRIIDFYIHEANLYEYTKRINFQGEVKAFLKSKMKGEQDK